MASDVKEYMWPPPERPDVEHQVFMQYNLMYWLEYTKAFISETGHHLGD